MPTVNEQILDAEIRHQVGLHRYSSGVVKDIIALLNQVDRDLVQKLIDFDLTPGRSAASRQRLQNLLDAVREIIQEGYNAVHPTLRSDLADLADYEAGFQQRLVQHAAPIKLDIIKPSVEQLAAAVTSLPFEGALLSEWADKLERDAFEKVRNAIRIGFTQGETIPEMVRRLRGTRARQFQDGVLQINRRNAEAVVRTAVGHVASSARQEFLRANEDLLQGVLWASTLDSRTTPICRARDGKLYTVDGQPIGHKNAWLGGPGKAHWQCRSSAVPVLKSWQELGVDIEEAPPSTRASMNGQVPEDTTYQEWLKRQPDDFQDDVLGPTRGALFRQGGVTVDRFVDHQGRQYTLDELRARESAAFEKASLAA